MDFNLKTSIFHIITQLVLWGMLLCLPVICTLASGGSWNKALDSFWEMIPNYVMWMGGFYLNYVLYIPRILMKKHIWQYILVLVVTYYVMGRINGFLYWTFTGEEWQGTGYKALDITISIGQCILNMLLCLAAIAMRSQQRNKQLESELQELRNNKSTEFIDDVVAEPVDSNMDISEYPNVSQQDDVEPSFIFVKCEAKLVRVDVNDILYISALKDYVRIHLVGNARPLIALSTMKAIEEKLPKSKFCKVHRSYIVSMDKIESVERNRIAIAGERIPVSDTYQAEFSSRLS